MKHLNEQKQFNLNEVEEHANKIVAFLSNIHVEKVACWGPLNVEINSRISVCMYHHLVYVETIHEEINWNLKKRKGKKAANQLINLKWNFICSITVFVRINNGKEKGTIHFKLSSIYF